MGRSAASLFRQSGWTVAWSPVPVAAAVIGADLTVLPIGLQSAVVGGDRDTEGTPDGTADDGLVAAADLAADGGTDGSSDSCAEGRSVAIMLACVGRRQGHEDEREREKKYAQHFGYSSL